MRLCIGTGWCVSADQAQYCNPNRSKLTFDERWLSQYWKPYIERYVTPEKYVIYISNSRVYPIIQWDQDKDRIEVVHGFDPVETLDHRHDFFASVLLGAQYALLNAMDYVYIEQDCLVKGLDRALAWARDKRLCYGYGDKCCYSAGWAAQSFMWVRNDFLPEFIGRLNVDRCFDSAQQPGGEPVAVPEVIFHYIFKAVASFWPFGYDRKRPPGFSLDEEMFFVQQCSDLEIEYLMGKT
jgi:hypothetical protein